ncbi:MAG: hypothetical protein ACOY0T_07585 [Myxococcota bacterium]
MATLPFDPTAAVRFDLARGQIAVPDSGERVLIPADALLTLCDAADGEARKDFARRLGTEVGRRAAERLGSVDGASAESVVEHLGGDLALMGLGSLELERWGKALVLAFTGSPFGARGDELLASTLEGAIQRAFGRDVGVAKLSRDDARARFIVTSRAGAERVKNSIDAGRPWGEVLTELANNTGAA